MQVSSNFKNNPQPNLFNPSINFIHKSKEHKKRRKKNSYTDNFIDRRKLSIESSKEMIKTKKRSPSNKVGKVTKNNININKNKKNNINYHIKHQNKSKNNKKDFFSKKIKKADFIRNKKETL